MLIEETGLLNLKLQRYGYFVCIVGSQFKCWLSLESHSWRRVGGQFIRSDSCQSSVEMSDKLASTLAFIKKFMA